MICDGTSICSSVCPIYPSFTLSKNPLKSPSNMYGLSIMELRICFQAVSVPRFGRNPCCHSGSLWSRNFTKNWFHVWRYILHNGFGTPSGLHFPFFFWMYTRAMSISAVGLSHSSRYLFRSRKKCSKCMVRCQFGYTCLTDIIYHTLDLFIKWVAIRQYVFGDAFSNLSIWCSMNLFRSLLRYFL